MTIASSDWDVAIRAMRGESDMNVVNPALGDTELAQSIALALAANSIVRAVAALSGRLTALPDPPTIVDPAFHDAVVRLIETSEGWFMPYVLAQIALAGWGAKLADTLVDAVTNKTSSAGVAGALIGPRDESAALLHNASDSAFAVRRCGCTTFPTKRRIGRSPSCITIGTL